jgi:type IV pilus assembly protein PilA
MAPDPGHSIRNITEKEEMSKTSLGKSKKQRGFTLVELLVVIGIIGALAAVVIPNVSRFAGSGDTAANDTELQTVQAAVDLYMSENALTTITAQAVAESDMTATTPALNPSYLRQTTTKCTYTWTTAGVVTQAACP